MSDTTQGQFLRISKSKRLNFLEESPKNKCLSVYRGINTDSDNWRKIYFHISFLLINLINTKHSRRFKRIQPIGEDDSLAYSTSCPVLNATKVPLTDMKRNYYLNA